MNTRRSTTKRDSKRNAERDTKTVSEVRAVRASMWREGADIRGVVRLAREAAASIGKPRRKRKPAA